MSIELIGQLMGIIILALGVEVVILIGWVLFQIIRGDFAHE